MMYLEMSGKINNEELPQKFSKYFWDVSLHDLSIEKNLRFITERILNYGDLDDIHWLLTITDRDFIKIMVNNSRNLNPKTRNFWKTILA
jgi:hypothetical protein